MDPGLDRPPAPSVRETSELLGWHPLHLLCRPTREDGQVLRARKGTHHEALDPAADFDFVAGGGRRRNADARGARPGGHAPSWREFCGSLDEGARAWNNTPRH